MKPASLAVLLAVAIGLFNGCGPQSTPAPPSAVTCELNAPEVLLALHRSRLHTKEVPPQVRWCLVNSPGAPPDVAYHLKSLQEGGPGLTTLRRQVYARHGFQITGQQLEEALSLMFEPELALELARIHVSYGNLQAAHDLLRKAIKEAPDDPLVVASWLQLAEQRGASWAQRAELAASLTTTPDHPRVWRTLIRAQKPNGLARFAYRARYVASLAARAGDSLETGSEWQAALLGALDQRPEAWRPLGQLPTCEGEPVRGECVAWNTALASAAWRQGDLRKALTQLDSLIVQRPWDPSPARRAAEIRQELGHLGEEALLRQQAYRAIAHQLDRVGDNPDLWLALSTAALQLGQVEEALEAADFATKLAPNRGDGWLRVAALSDDVGLQREALDTGIRLLREDSAASGYHGNLLTWGLIRELHRLQAEETRLWLEGLEVESPPWPEVQLALCQLHIRDGDNGAALRACERALKHAPAWRQPRRRMLDLVAGTDRIQLLRDLLTLNPLDSVSRTQLSAALEDVGQYSEAARVATEPMSWPGVAPLTMQRLTLELAGQGMPNLASWLDRSAISAWASGLLPGYHQRAAARLLNTGERGPAFEHALTAVRLSGDANAILEFTAAVSHSDMEIARSSLERLPGLNPVIVDQSEAARLARKLGSERVLQWLECRRKADSSAEKRRCR